MLRLNLEFDGNGWIISGTDIPLIAHRGMRCSVSVAEHHIGDGELQGIVNRCCSRVILPAGSVVMSYVSTPVQSDHIVRDLRVVEHPPGTVNSGYIAVHLVEPLVLMFQPPREPVLRDSACWIPALQKHAESLNESHTRISEQFEPHRRSHHGSVFRRVLFKRATSSRDTWVRLAALRAEAQEHFEAETSRLLKDAYAAGSLYAPRD